MAFDVSRSLSPLSDVAMTSPTWPPSSPELPVETPTLRQTAPHPVASARSTDAEKAADILAHLSLLRFSFYGFIAEVLTSESSYRGKFIGQLYGEDPKRLLDIILYSKDRKRFLDQLGWGQSYLRKEITSLAEHSLFYTWTVAGIEDDAAATMDAYLLESRSR